MRGIEQDRYQKHGDKRQTPEHHSRFAPIDELCRGATPVDQHYHRNVGQVCSPRRRGPLKREQILFLAERLHPLAVHEGQAAGERTRCNADPNGDWQAERSNNQWHPRSSFGHEESHREPDTEPQCCRRMK